MRNYKTPSRIFAARWQFVALFWLLPGGIALALGTAAATVYAVRPPTLL